MESAIWDTTLGSCVPNIAVHLFGRIRCKWGDRILLLTYLLTYLHTYLLIYSMEESFLRS